MTRPGCFLGLTCAVLIGASVAGAQIGAYAAPSAAADVGPGARPASPFEISPTVGFMGGSALLGVRAGLGNPAFVELSAEQVIGRTATLYPLTVNLVYDLATGSRAVPYGLVGGGLFLTVPLNTVGDESISSVGLCFGGGLKYFLTRKIGIRFETKQLFTRVRNHADDRQELLFFQSTSLGVVFAFG